MNLSDLPEEIALADQRVVKKASCGDKHAFVLLDNGILLMSGKNDVGQLGIDPKEFPEV